MIFSMVNCLSLKLNHKIRKMFLSPGQESNLQPSDLQWDALIIELPGLRWQREGYGVYWLHAYVLALATRFFRDCWNQECSTPSWKQIQWLLLFLLYQIGRSLTFSFLNQPLYHCYFTLSNARRCSSRESFWVRKGKLCLNLYIWLASRFPSPFPPWPASLL